MHPEPQVPQVADVDDDVNSPQISAVVLDVVEPTISAVELEIVEAAEEEVELLPEAPPLHPFTQLDAQSCAQVALQEPLQPP